jgi:hypothetical protein
MRLMGRMNGRRTLGLLALAMLCACGSVSGKGGGMGGDSGTAGATGTGGAGGVTATGGTSGTAGATGTGGASDGGAAGSGAGGVTAVVTVRGGIRALSSVPFGSAIKVSKQSLSLAGPPVCGASVCLANSRLDP